ncbi:MAG: hypothetical protein QOI41_254, partial [Myxococcales bacterium]|nr:hypothetical protein [Myxococcales bacterium]
MAAQQAISSAHECMAPPDEPLVPLVPASVPAVRQAGGGHFDMAQVPLFESAVVQAESG